MKWQLISTMCGAKESLLKYKSEEYQLLMMEINEGPRSRHIVYYWEDEKPIYNTSEEALKARQQQGLHLV